MVDTVREVDTFELAEPAFDLAVRGELVADLDRQLRQLILDMMKHQRANGHEHPAVLDHGFDLRDERVIHLERLHRTQGRFREQRTCRGDRIDGVGLVQPS